MNLQNDICSIFEQRKLIYIGKVWTSFQQVILYRMLWVLCRWTDRKSYRYVVDIIGNDVLLATHLAGQIYKHRTIYREEWKAGFPDEIRRMAMAKVWQDQEFMSALLYPCILGFNHLPLLTQQGLTFKSKTIGETYWEIRKYLQKMATYIHQSTMGPLFPRVLHYHSVLSEKERMELPQSVQNYILAENSYLLR